MLIQLFVDPEYHIVINTATITNIDKIDIDKSIVRVEHDSYISNKRCLVYSIDSTDYDDVIINELLINPDKYIFKDNKFFKRPELKLELEGKRIQKLSEYNYVAPLNEDITVNIKYIDPDKFNFYEEFDYVKVKDRYKFAILSTKQVPRSKNMKFTIRSNYPGVSKIRVKDNKYLCYFVPVMVRFDQSLSF